MEYVHSTSNLRRDGVRAAAQHALLGAGRSSGGADLD
jgi:hypothetical protein